VKANIGNTDRVLRVILGVALLSMFLVAESSLRWWGLLGIVPLVTAALGFCPLYAVLGISTRSRTRALKGR
jgi:Protein of unknown function (DUF2892)